MTASEFEREFDILYNNIASNAAPSIDAYEKSVFLTKAQEDIVTALYDGSFEGSEKLTEYLNDLIVSGYKECPKDVEPSSSDIQNTYTVEPNNRIVKDSYVFKIPQDVLFIVYESIDIHSREIPVRPIRHDEYNRIRNNPFKKPRKTEALRITSNQNNQNIVEILSTYKEFIYKFRYIRKPKPIILYSEQGLTIDNVDSITNTNSPCELNSALHRIILETAVQQAASVYRQ